MSTAGPIQDTTEQTYRVTYGWSCYEDFSDETAALAYAKQRATQPVSDRLCHLVEILDLTQSAPYPVLWSATRPAR